MGDVEVLDAAARAAARFDLTGRVAVVTGGGSGLGAAIACALAEHGADVAVLDVNEQGARDVEQSIAQRGRRTWSATVDIRRSDQLDAAAERIRAELGSVDILVNSAGVTYHSPAEAFPDEQFERVLDVNLKGTFYACRTFGRGMVEQGSGSIINLASIAGLIGYPDSVAYISSKGGVVQMTRGLAVEWRERDVRVNAIAPSVIDTPFTRGGGLRADGGVDASGSHVDSGSTARGSFLIDRSLRGSRSIGKPADVAGVAVFLASDAARLITGHTLPVDDGYVAA